MELALSGLASNNAGHRGQTFVGVVAIVDLHARSGQGQRLLIRIFGDGQTVAEIVGDGDLVAGVGELMQGTLRIRPLGEFAGGIEGEALIAG